MDPAGTTDRTLELLAAYAHGAAREGLPPVTEHEVRRRVLDSIGVAIAGLDEPAPTAARRYAERLPGPVTLWGTPERASLEAAGFANGVAVRCLDFNDTYLSREPLHPSDVIAPLLALAEERGLPARDLLAAIAIAYELGVRLCDATSFRAHGFDHVNVIGIATAAAAGRLLDLDAERIRHGISLAVVPHVALRETRAGELSMWKGAAAAHAGRLGVTAALLAEAGMTGPFRPFEGEMGLVQRVLGGEPLDPAPLEGLAELAPPERITDTYVKRWPVEYHAQSAVDAALQLYTELAGGGVAADDIASVRIDTFRAAYEIIAKDPEKWDPRTRETADHSIQYIVCAALQDGEITERTFDLERIRRPDTLELLQRRTTVELDEALTAGYPEGIPNRITVTTADGRTLVREVTYPRGHARNPMTDEELVAKYRANVTGRFSRERAEAVERAVWALGEGDVSVEPLLEALRG